jgi:hypothetical protein
MLHDKKKQRSSKWTCIVEVHPMRNSTGLHYIHANTFLQLWISVLIEKIAFIVHLSECQFSKYLLTGPGIRDPQQAHFLLAF